MPEMQTPEIKTSQYSRCSLRASRVELQRLKEVKIVGEAIQRLKDHLHFKSRGDWIQLDLEDAGALRLKGVLPTFYLKQLAQEAVRDIEGVRRVQNDIAVTGPIVESDPNDDYKSAVYGPREVHSEPN